MKIFNYSSLKKSEKKVYNIMGYPIPGGIGLNVIIVSLVSVLIFNLIGYPILHLLGIKYFSIANGQFIVGIIMIVMPIIVGCSISKIKIQGISIFDYIIEAIKYAIKPKNTSLLGEKSNDKEEHITFDIDDPI